MLFRLVAILPIFAVYAAAQFFSLATSGDGSQLYFATPLRQKDTTTPQPDWGKLFRIDVNGLSLQESRAYQAPLPLLPPGPASGRYSLSNPYDLQFTDVTSDGDGRRSYARQDYISDTLLCAKKD